MNRVRISSLWLLSAVSVWASSKEQITIVETRSTNRPQITIKVQSAKHAFYETDSASAPISFDLDPVQGARLFLAAHAAAPLASLPLAHCMKSISFGTAIFVQMGSDRSPDLSCPNAADPRASTLANEVRQLLKQIRQQQRPR